MSPAFNGKSEVNGWFSVWIQPACFLAHEGLFNLFVTVVNFLLESLAS